MGNERGGKHIVLKLGKAFSAATNTTSGTEDQITITAHGAAVGDILKFLAVGASGFSTSLYYFVTSIVDANKITVSATPGGSNVDAAGIEAALSVVLFRDLTGLREKSLSFSSESVDITNHDSDEWKEMLDGAGIRSVSISGTCVYANDDIQEEVEDAARSNALKYLAIIEATGRVYAGKFKLTSVEASGSYDGEASFNFGAESSGAIDFFRAA